MARKSEAGIEYFPMNSDIILNPKIKLMVAEFGSKTTWTVLLPLYCKIYREKGYWVDWFDDDSKLLFAQDDCKIELSVVNELVNGCIRRSLFNKRVFDMFGVLTSDRIQENFLIAKKRNQSVDFIDEFNVLSDKVFKSFKNVNIIDLNVNILSKKVNIGTQKKKENKILEVEGDGDVSQKHTIEEFNLFKNFEKFIADQATNVSKMKEPFTIDQYLKLKESFSSEQIKEMLLKMHNYKPLVQKNISANLTFLNWHKREYNSDSGAPKVADSKKLSDAVKAIEKAI